MDVATECRTTVVQLPYGLETPNGVVREVELREMTGADEKLLTRRATRNIGKMITTLLSNLVIRIGDVENEDVESRSQIEELVRTMSWGDRDYLLYEARKLTEGDQLTMENVRCRLCEEEADYEIDLADIAVRRAPDPKDGDFSGRRFRHTFRRSVEGVEWVECRYPTGDMQERLASVIRQRPVEAMHRILFACIEKTSTGEKPTSLIDRMNKMDVRALRKGLQEEAPGIGLMLDLSCHHCGGTFKEMLDLAGFFL